MYGITCIDGNPASRPCREPAQMHQALFYAGEREYVDGIMRFITPGLKADEPVAVAIPRERGDLLRRALNGYADAVEILDMYELGRNPARIIPAVEAMLSDRDGTLLHYVGEPIWPGRSQEEIQEATKHEALINLAWPGSPIRVLCPYDAERLPREVLADAERTHPTVLERGRERSSSAYEDAATALGSDQPLSAVPATADELPFELTDLSRVRALVAERARRAGLSQDRVHDLVLAVSELAANAVRHGSGGGLLRVWDRPDRLICQVEDRGHILDPLAGRRRPVEHGAGGLGLWTVNQLCDLVEVRTGDGGTTVRVHASFD